MDDLYVKRWLKKIKECRKLTQQRHDSSNHRDLSWELRKLDDMERRLKKDRYMYWSYQAMLRDWLHPNPRFDPYYRKKINPEMLERSEPKGKNNACVTIETMLEIRGALTGREGDEDIEMALGVLEELVQRNNSDRPNF